MYIFYYSLEWLNYIVLGFVIRYIDPSKFSLTESERHPAGMSVQHKTKECETGSLRIAGHKVAVNIQQNW